MDREDIIRMAREAGAGVTGKFGRTDYIIMTRSNLERFAALVAAAERRAIAQSLDKQADLAPDDIDRHWAQEMAAAVRARSNT